MDSKGLRAFVAGVATAVAFAAAVRLMRWLWEHDSDLARLAAAPPDDEPVTEADVDAVRAATRRIKAGKGIPGEHVFREAAKR